MIPQDFLQAAARKQGVSDTELEALSLAMDGQSTAAIAHQLDISADAVRKRLSEVYQKFHISGKGPVKLAQLQQLLVSQYQAHQQQQETGNFASPVAAALEISTPHQDWGEAPDVSVFYGRSEQLASLKQWIIKDGYRLVALLGMPGIGKTFLAVKLAQQIHDEFEIVIWRSLRNAPPPQELLAELLKVLCHRQETDLPRNVDEGVSRLIGYLRSNRCLLVLDGVETILRSGGYSKGYEGYGVLLRRVGEEQHQSCLVVSSQEKLREIALLESSTRPVCSLQLEGLNPNEAEKILQEKGLTGEQQWETLIRLYRGNPLALKLVAATIEDVFNKDVAEFIKWGTIVLRSDYRELLDEQFKRLSSLEKEVMQELAKEDKPISFQKLRETRPEIATSELIEALESLGGGRSLIEKVPSKNTKELLFTLQPVVKKYIKKYHLPARSKG